MRKQTININHHGKPILVALKNIAKCIFTFLLFGLMIDVLSVTTFRFTRKGMFTSIEVVSKFIARIFCFVSSSCPPEMNRLTDRKEINFVQISRSLLKSWDKKHF